MTDFTDPIVRGSGMRSIGGVLELINHMEKYSPNSKVPNICGLKSRTVSSIEVAKKNP